MSRLLLVALLFTGIALAQNASVALRWTAPSAHTDGSGITAALTYNVYSGAKGSPKTKLGSTTSGTTTFAAPSSTVGTCFAVSAVESGVGESAQSDELCVAAPPNKPTGLIFVTVSIVP